MNNFNEYPETENSEQQENKYTSSDKKGILLVVVLAIVVVVFIFKLLGSSDRHTDVNADLSTTAPTTVTTAVPTTPVPTQPTVPTTSAVQSTVPVQTTSAVNTTAPTTTIKYELTKADILAKVNEGINSLKADTASFTAHKKQVISIDLLDCSVPALTGAINMVIDFFEGEKTADYDITNGKGADADGEEIVVNHEIPPTDKPFSLTEQGVAEAKAEQTGEGTLYTIKVVPETSTLENPRPPHHNAACDTLDFSTFDLPVGELTKVDFEYPGATVSVLVDSSGKIIRYRERLEMKGAGEGGAFGITGSGVMEGYVDEVWDIQWK
ncbi:MAG: hypothetical protein IJB74_05260 [Clostridia bacterium]|nr:hypothetical protein [Clostridia bacterium]